MSPYCPYIPREIVRRSQYGLETVPTNHAAASTVGRVPIYSLKKSGVALAVGPGVEQAEQAEQLDSARTLVLAPRDTEHTQ
jgi:hypothetical protein